MLQIKTELSLRRRSIAVFILLIKQMLVANTNTHFLEQKEDLKKGIHKKTLKTATLMTDNN